jgi:hypothetical protein
MGLSARKAIVLGKLESVAGTDPVPTVAANAIQCKNVNITPLRGEFKDRNLVRPYFGASGTVLVGRDALIDFEVELTGSGTAGTAPAFGPLLKACDMLETLTASTKADYTPLTGGTDTLTLYTNIDGIQYKITGAKGSWMLDMKAKDFPTLKFSFLGTYNAPVDATLSAPVYTAWKDPVPADKVFTPTFLVHGQSGCFESFSVDYGNVVTHSVRIGCDVTSVTDRNTKGSVEFEMQLVAQKNWIETVRQATRDAVQIIHGNVAGNICEITGPKVQLLNPSFGETDGLHMIKLDTSFTSNVGNDEIRLSFR